MFVKWMVNLAVLSLLLGVLYVGVYVGMGS